MRTSVRVVLALGAVGVAVPAAWAQGSPRAFTPADWYKVTTLSSPAVSPDG